VNRPVSRRAVLVAGAGVAWLAGCGDARSPRDAGASTVWRVDPPVYSNIAALAVGAGQVVVSSRPGAGGPAALYSLSASTGSQRWQFEADDLVTGDEPSSVPAPLVAADTVYAARGTHSAPAGVYAVDAATGRKRWSFHADTTGPASAPVLAGDTVYFGTAGAVYAVDARTGRARWRRPTRGRCSSPAVAGGTVYVGDDLGHAYAFAATGGRPQWRVSCRSGSSRPSSLFTSPPLVAGGLVYLVAESPGAGEPVLFAVDRVTGGQRWSAVAPAETTSYADLYHGPVLLGSSVIVVNNQDGAVYAVDAGTGHRRWRSAPPGAAGSIGGLAVAGDRTVLVGNRKGGLVGLDAATGAQRWRFGADGLPTAGPVFAGGVGYVGLSADPPYVTDVYAFRL
jgi:outer membrane protein assembly factor BamB